MRAVLFVLVLTLPFFTNSAFAQVDTITCVWLEPSTINVGVQYEKIEWGIVLPPKVQEAVQNWISNQRNGTDLQPSVNPFDPEQLDVTGYITRTNVPSTGGLIEEVARETVYGFYFEDYRRNISSSDKNQWDWADKKNNYPFRIRWAAPVAGSYFLELGISCPSLGVKSNSLLRFSVTEGDAKRGFIRISENKHFLATPDGEVYFPVGRNVWEGAYDCGCNIPCVPEEKLPKDKTYPCEGAYQKGDDDICCGLNVINRMNRCKPWNPNKTVREMCLPLASYLKLHEVLEQFSSSGGNTVRFPIYQSSFDVEFEKVNNYLDRQYQAWEFDKMLEKCDDLNLRIQLNMGIQTPYQNHPYGNVNWDFFDTNICDEEGKSQAWCYKKELGLSKPIEFFTNQRAKELYKKKLRYFIARWGYSSRLMLIELFSEMNGVESGTVYNHPAEGCDWWNKAKHLPMLYDLDMKYREALSTWNTEMSDYVKNKLGHRKHLLAVDYTGKAPMSPYLDSEGNPCASSSFDESWADPNLDVICWNNYGAGATRFRGFAVDEYGTKDRPTGFLCENGSPIYGFEKTSKPILYGENGFGDAIMICDYTGFVKELVSLPFSGHANSGMSWDEISDTTHWSWMGSARRFMEEQVLSKANIGKGGWRPGYSNSENGGTSRVETVYLMDDDRGKKKAAGVIMNRSWNWFTIGEGGICDTQPDESVIPSFMNTFVAAGPNDEPVKIGSMELLRKYTIEYFDPKTLEKIGTETISSGGGKLELVNYPTLTMERPFVYFKVSRAKTRRDDVSFTGE